MYLHPFIASSLLHQPGLLSAGREAQAQVSSVSQSSCQLSTLRWKGFWDYPELLHFKHLYSCIFFLVNQWTKTLQSRAAFIWLDLLVLNNLLQVCLITLSKSSSPASPVDKDHVSPSHPMALPNAGDFNTSKEPDATSGSTQSLFAFV